MSACFHEGRICQSAFMKAEYVSLLALLYMCSADEKQLFLKKKTPTFQSLKKTWRSDQKCFTVLHLGEEARD